MGRNVLLRVKYLSRIYYHCAPESDGWKNPTLLKKLVSYIWDSRKIGGYLIFHSHIDCDRVSTNEKFQMKITSPFFESISNGLCFLVFKIETVRPIEGSTLISYQIEKRWCRWCISRGNTDRRERFFCWMFNIGSIFEIGRRFEKLSVHPWHFLLSIFSSWILLLFGDEGNWTRRKMEEFCRFIFNFYLCIVVHFDQLPW